MVDITLDLSLRDYAMSTQIQVGPLLDHGRRMEHGSWDELGVW